MTNARKARARKAAPAKKVAKQGPKREQLIIRNEVVAVIGGDGRARIQARRRCGHVHEISVGIGGGKVSIPFELLIVQVGEQVSVHEDCPTCATTSEKAE